MEFSNIRSAATVEQLVRQHGSFLLVGIDGRLWCFDEEKLPKNLRSCLKLYSPQLKAMLKELAAET